MSKEKNTKPAKKPAAKAKPATRRPDANLPPPKAMIQVITTEVLGFINDLNEFAANLRALDRQRHNGVGLKRQGFIEAALHLSTQFPQYFPRWLAQKRYALLSLEFAPKLCLVQTPHIYSWSFASFPVGKAQNSKLSGAAG